MSVLHINKYIIFYYIIIILRGIFKRIKYHQIQNSMVMRDYYTIVVNYTSFIIKFY